MAIASATAPAPYGEPQPGTARTAPDEPSSSLPDDELLRIVGDERKRAVGFETDSALITDRERALNYYKGVMPDVVAPANRSQAVSTDVPDAVRTIMPDLVEIFTGGEDVAAFVPTGPQDEAAAQQETDYVRHVVFNDNDGWRTLYTMFQDALVVKTGLVKYWWEDYTETEQLRGVNLLELQAASQDAELSDVRPSAEAAPEDGGYGPIGQLFDATATRRGGKLCVRAIPPDDFTVAADTVSLKDATYCCMRSRPRAQELLARGIAEDVVERLPSYGVLNDQVNIARDTANESSLSQGAVGQGDLRQVEVHEHYVRIREGDELVLHRVETDGTDSVLIDREVVERIQIAAITPFLVSHRFHGLSVADLLGEIQKINTALTRAHLDSVYFALNQRMEVAEVQANEFTISDLLRNEPGIPVRSKTGNALRPITAGGAGFNALESLEYFQTVSERRSGIVRAAQGLTPDTLHETARGALALLSQAQKRVRLIARTFAETGVKDLFLGVHALLRQHATQAQTVRLRGQWVNIDPTSWGERTDMTVEVGLGASGAEVELQALQGLLPVFEQVIQMQGGPHGPLVNLQNVYALLKRLVEKSGVKSPDSLVTDPSAPPAPGTAPVPPPAPPPNPELIKAQGQMQAAQAKIIADQRTAQAKAQADAQLDLQRATIDAQVERYKADQQAQLAREKMAQDLQIEREKIAADVALNRELAMAKMAGAVPQAMPPIGGIPG
jgi:hypothetical protein